MTYKRYIRVNGKLYGPYEYWSKRKGNKVISTYVGKSEKKFGEVVGRSVKNINSNYLVLFEVLAIIALGLLILATGVNFYTTGYSIEEESALTRGVQDYGIQDLSPGNITECGTISSAGVYTLNQSIYFGDAGQCLTVASNNVEINGNGYNISSSCSNTGILANTGGTIVNITIKNLKINGFSTGISFSHVVNYSIVNITQNNTGCSSVTGFSITDSHFGVIENNTLEGDDTWGINFMDMSGISSNNTIRRNIVSMGGIQVQGSNNTISYNTINGGGSGYGVNVGSGERNKIKQNVIDTGNYGIYISSSNNNEAINNSISSFGTEGIYAGGNQNNFENSTISDCAKGIYVSNSGANNKFTNIVISSSSDHAVYIDSGTYNNFTNISISGTNPSYYDINYAADNLDRNYFIDTPMARYNFAGAGAGSLVYFKDTGQGEIKFTAAINASGENLSKDIWIGNNVVYVNSTVTDLNKSADVVLYNVPVFDNPKMLRDGVECNDTTVPTCTNTTSLTAGTVMFGVTSWSNYSIGGGGEVDVGPPVIVISYPQNTSYNVNVTALNYSVSDLNMRACWYSLNLGETNTTITCGDNVTGLTSTEGSNSWIVYANDTVGQENFTQVTFFKDTIIPGIQFGSLTESSGTYVGRNNSVINVTANDTNLANITINLYNLTGLVNSSASTSGSYLVNITNLADGIYYFNATAFDSVGNSNSTATRSVTIDTIYPLIEFLYDGTGGFTDSDADGGNYSKTQISASANLTETNKANVTFRLYNSSYGLLYSNTTSTFTYSGSNVFAFITWESLSNGVYYYNISVMDLALNVNSTGTRRVTLDTVKPVPQFVAPSETSGTRINRNYTLINVSSSDDRAGVANVTIRLYNSSKGLVNSTSTTGHYFVNITNLADGIYYFNATAIDWAGNKNSTETRNVTVDTINPAINFTSPTPSPNSYVNYSDFVINISVSDANWNSTTIQIYNSTLTNQTINTTVMNLSLTNTIFKDGNISILAWATDLAGNINYTEQRNFTLDTTNPAINFTSQTEASGNFIPRANIIVNVTSTDINLKNITIRLYNSAKALINQTNSSINSLYANFSGLSDGIYYFNATAIDLAGNSNSTETRNVTIDLTNPIVNITSPTNITYTTSSVSVDIRLNERGYCEFSLDNGVANETLAANSSNSGFTGTKTSANGNYLLWAYCNDSAGNRNDTERVNFSINVASSPGSTTGGGGGPRRTVPAQEENVSEVSPEAAEEEKVALSPVVETVEEGVEVAKKAFDFTRFIRIAIEAVVGSIGVVLATLAYFKVIKPARMARIAGGPRRRFMALAGKANMALRKKDYKVARAIYEKMRFDYHVLGSKEQKEMKEFMDEIYEKLK